MFVSDSFELETQAFVKIDKYEIKLEKILNQNELFKTPQTHNTLSQTNLWRNMNINNRNNYAPLRVENKTTLSPSPNQMCQIPSQNYQTPLKPTSLEKPFETGISALEEESDELWDLIDDLLQNKNTHNEKKMSPKKSDLIPATISTKKLQMCVLDSDEEELIEAALLTQTQKKSIDKRISQDFNETENRPKRNQSPMSIEMNPHVSNMDTSTRASDLIEIEPEISQKKLNSQQKNSFENKTIEIEEDKPSIILQFSSPVVQESLFDRQDMLKPLTFSQQSQTAKASREQTSHKDKENTALSKEQQLEIIQLIGDKRHSLASAKNSVVKGQSNQKMAQEANECRICLST